MGVGKSPKGDQNGRGAGFWALKRRPCSNTACMTAFPFWSALLFGQKNIGSLSFFYHALFHTVGSFLGLRARSPFRGVMWSHVRAARECEGRERRGASTLPSCSASSNMGRGLFHSIKPGFAMIAAKEKNTLNLTIKHLNIYQMKGFNLLFSYI